jgi:acetylornithine deacetylase
LISGGTGVNIVPQSCTIYVDRRTVPGEQPEVVWRDYKATLEALRPGNIELPEPDLLDFPLETDPRAEVVQRLSASLAAVGVTPEVVGVTYGTDASKIARAGIPAVVFGPGSIRDAHRPDESVDLVQVQVAVEAITHLLEHFGGEA